mgnify:CR=1 FL=1
MTTDSLIFPDWPAPKTIKALSTTRQGGFSLPPYDGFNLGTHVGDNPNTVIKNRDYLIDIIEKTIAELRCAPQDILVWLGPAIGPNQFEVGHDVYQTFTHYSAEARQAFQQTDATHYLADIYFLARQRLSALGIHAVFGGDLCTASDQHHFFSYRRDDITGRMASMIWISHK